MRKDVIVAVLGFLVGAAALAGGEEDDELREKLEKLKQEVTRSLRQLPDRAEGFQLGRDGQEMDLFPVMDLTAGIPWHIRPDHRLSPKGEHPLFGGLAEEWPRPVGTIEECMEVVRSFVWPESWEEGGAFVGTQGQVLLARNSRAVINDIGKFLNRLRTKMHRCVTVELEVMDVPVALYRELQKGAATSLDAAQRSKLDTALGQGTAQRVFGGRATGFVGQAFLFWHGRQVAVHAEADVEVAQRTSAHDPVVQIVQDGGYLSVRPSVGEDATRVTLDLAVQFDQLDPKIEGLDTKGGGRIERPSIRVAGTETTVTVPNRGWAMVGAGTPKAESVRLLLVRASYLKGGAR